MLPSHLPTTSQVACFTAPQHAVLHDVGPALAYAYAERAIALT